MSISRLELCLKPFWNKHQILTRIAMVALLPALPLLFLWAMREEVLDSWVFMLRAAFTRWED